VYFGHVTDPPRRLTRRDWQSEQSTHIKEKYPMGQCSQQVFSNITPDQFAKLIEKAQAAGIPINGESGVAVKMGIEVTWNYSPASGQLAIQCTHVPFFVSCNLSVATT
jgi:hypothetical protein